ncbi:glycosyltransferase family 2 protein [Mangrovivirga sp. M17]|uniref:Glycosyltransferase family 2 protein n=1 Tax=Mangrovivirga halotolerans TaxID=2993936 RepID=A0ABT3RTT4_9BACT|nr:glycosyltransferase family 2 protein [Mangrovivirga halotolerans]MCX2745196.1 glycosyltransferase family 2 protein [Mangrovivirga halotolerans]
MSHFKVSVIIPVYNAEKYLEHAVKSAINQKEVGEILLIEDRSPDNALELCKSLADKYDKVKLFTHPNRENKGAGPSRNLGIEYANCEYISFLDADDWYLPGRFSNEAELFNNSNVYGVYSCAQYYSEKKVKSLNKFARFHQPYSGINLFHKLLIPGAGSFCTNCITIRKDIFNEIQAFREDLRLHQDSELWGRLCFHYNVVPGKWEKPTAMIRVHDENRISTSNFKTKSFLANIQYEYFSNIKSSLDYKSKYILAYRRALFNIRKAEYPNSIKFRITRLKYFFKWYLRIL